MCGICGVAGFHLDREDRNVFSELLLCSSLRGMDSTGVVNIKQSSNKGQQVGDWDVIRTLGPPTDLFGYRDYSSVVDNGNAKGLIGHCRKATIGAKTKKNAHPFQFDSIVGVHNGSIYGAMPNRSRFDTDSETLYYNINELGIHEAIETLPNNAAYSLVWFDSKDNTLNFLRNKERPMYFTSNQSRNVLYWASEPGMLAWILGRNDNCEHYKINPVPADTHFKLKLFEGPEWMTKTEKEVIKPKEAGNTGVPFRWGQETAEAASWETPTTEVAQLAATAQRVAEQETKQNQESIKSIIARRRATLPLPEIQDGGRGTESSPKAVSNEVALTTKASADIPIVRWYNGQEVTKEAYKSLLDMGCFACGNKSNYGGTHMHIAPVAYLCDKCMELPVDEVTIYKKLANDPDYSKLPRTYVQ